MNSITSYKLELLMFKKLYTAKTNIYFIYSND
jgi:hypothetical protein